MNVCLTVDFEQDCPPFLNTWRGMEEGAGPLLDLFNQEQVPATFFTTGQTAQRYPDMVRRIVSEDHELACHGFTHRAFTDMGQDTARKEIEDAADVLRAWAPVTSFRAPYLKFPNRYLHILEANGFLLDSSEAKYKFTSPHDRTSTTLVRIPASVTSSVLRLPPWIRDPWLRQLSTPIVLFVHPWEFVDLRYERLRLDCRFKTGKVALDCLRDVIRLFKNRRACFIPMGNLVTR